MAKVSLKVYLNAELKKKGIGVKAAQKNAGKYKSIKAAKAAGSLYYTDKKGNIMAAVYAEDLNKKPAPAAPKDSKIITSNLDAKGNSRPGFTETKTAQASVKKIKKIADKAIIQSDSEKKVKKITNAAAEKSSAESKFNDLTLDQQKTVQNRVNNGMTRNNAIAKTYADTILEKPPTKKNKGGMIMKKKPDAAAKMMGGGMMRAKKKGASMYNKGGAAKKR